ncbi:MAG: TadE/TadG family type IV pilus assembly protein [Jatrophihabitantaceae bacterium]
MADRDRPYADDGGAAVVDFVMVSVLLVFLLFAVLQVAVYVYSKNVIGAAAADGARYGANAGVDPTEGGRRADALIGTGLNPEIAAAIPCTGSASVDAASGLPVTTVRCHGHLKLLFLPLSAPITIDVRSSALREQTP